MTELEKILEPITQGTKLSDITVKVLDVKPADILIVEYPSILSSRAKETIIKGLSHICHIVVLEEGLKAKCVLRKDSNDIST